MKKFKLIKEYPNSPELGTEVNYSEKHQIYNYNGGNIYTALPKHTVENLPEYWQEIKDNGFEILALVGNSESQGRCGDLLTDDENIEAWLRGNGTNSWDIHAIKRLSDGQIFTIGDYVQERLTNNRGKTWEIRSFKNNSIQVTECYISYTSNTTVSLFNIVKIAKEKLFTTEDGIDIYGGDKYSTVDSVWNVFKDCEYPYASKVGKIFSTKERAEEYVLMNKPCLSIKDICPVIGRANHITYIDLNQLAANLKALVKQKL